MAVVAAVTGDRGNRSYASELLGDERTARLEQDEDGKETEEELVRSELDEETIRRLEAEIEGLIVTEKTDDGEGVIEMRGGGEMPAEQETAAESDAVVVEAAKDEDAADAEADCSTAAEGIISTAATLLPSARCSRHRHCVKSTSDLYVHID